MIPSGNVPSKLRRVISHGSMTMPVVRTLVNKRLEMYGLMFYLANRSGLRLGEVIGLRISTLLLSEEIFACGLATTVLSKRISEEGKVKWVRRERRQRTSLPLACTERGGRGWRRGLLSL